MLTAKDLLNSKTKDIWSISPKKTVLDAVKLMAVKDVGAILVMDDDTPLGKAKILGILTERDYARKVILKGKASNKTLVSEIMTPVEKLYRIKPETSVEDCMVLITGKRVRHLPVFDGAKFVGLISIGDVVKATISSKDMLIEHLSNYISGTY